MFLKYFIFLKVDLYILWLIVFFSLFTNINFNLKKLKILRINFCLTLENKKILHKLRHEEYFECACSKFIVEYNKHGDIISTFQSLIKYFYIFL